MDVPPERWEAEIPALHRDHRYDRPTTDVRRLTGRPAMTVESFVAARRGAYLP